MQFLIKSKRLRLSESSSVPSSIILSSDEHADVYARSPHLVDVWNDWEKIWSDFSDLSKSPARGPLLERSWSSLPIFSQNLQYFHWIEFIGKLAKLVKNIPAVSPDRIGTKIDRQINRPGSRFSGRAQGWSALRSPSACRNPHRRTTSCGSTRCRATPDHIHIHIDIDSARGIMDTKLHKSSSPIEMKFWRQR